MKNEIGRKITSLTLMTIMIAGGMTFAIPGVMPAAHAQANANLFVSVEESVISDRFGGAMVVEVVVNDPDLKEIDEAESEPNVEVNTNQLRMAQADDGNWYGYFADRTLALAADALITNGPGAGTNNGTSLDFGVGCTPAAASSAGFGGVDFSDTVGVFVPSNDAGVGLGVAGALSPGCTGPSAADVGNNNMNVIRENRTLNDNTGMCGGGACIPPPGQIGLLDFPVIQLFDFTAGGDADIVYNIGGGSPQTVSIEFDDALDDHSTSGLSTDRSDGKYPLGAAVHMTINDVLLNIDPTDQDSWSFGSNASNSSTFYQVFTEDGRHALDLGAGSVSPPGAGLPDGNPDVVPLDVQPALGGLNFGDLGQLFINYDADASGAFVLNIRDNTNNNYSSDNTGAANDASYGHGAGPTFTPVANDGILSTTLGGTSAPITFVETESSSGIFENTDEGDTSDLFVSPTALRGTTAVIDYNDSASSVRVTFYFGTIDMDASALGGEWNSGEEIPVSLVDEDLNLNSRTDEDIDLSDASFPLVPSLAIGTPLTLTDLGPGVAVPGFSTGLPVIGVGSADLETAAGSGNDWTVQPFSFRANMGVGVAGGALPTTIPVTGENIFTFKTATTAAGLQAFVFNGSASQAPPAAPAWGVGAFGGKAAMLNYDIRTFAATYPGAAINITIAGSTTGQISGPNATGLPGAGPSQLKVGSGVCFTGGLTCGPNGANGPIAGLTTGDFQGLVDITNADLSVFAVGGDTINVIFNITGTGTGPELIAPGNYTAVVDFFNFGQQNDGVLPGDRFNNAIYRLELEESGDNTGTFVGSVEYLMLNQINVNDTATYTGGIDPISDAIEIIVHEDLTDEDSPRINYLDLGADGVSTQIADQQEAPTHSGVVAFDSSTYKIADTVTVTLEDPDLNIDVETLDVFTVVALNVIGAPDDAFDQVGIANYGQNTAAENFGRLLDITFNDELWRSGVPAAAGTCGPPAAPIGAGAPDDGLGATGFTLGETGPDTGVFIGDFQVPSTYCAAGAALGTGALVSVTGTDIEVNYVDYRDASGEIIEVGDGAGIRANTGSISLDRTVYPVPFGGVGDYVVALGGPLVGGNTGGESLFPIHATGINAGNLAADTAGALDTFETLGVGDLTIHLRVNDPDFDVSASGEDTIATVAGVPPVKLSISRASAEVTLGFAGGAAVCATGGIAGGGCTFDVVGADGGAPGIAIEPAAGDDCAAAAFLPGTTTCAHAVAGAASAIPVTTDPQIVLFGPIVEIAPDAGIFESDIPIRFFEGPSGGDCPIVPPVGASGVLGSAEDSFLAVGATHCILQGDILTVEYTDPTDASGDPNTVTDSATFDLRNGVLQSDKSVYIIGSDMILTLIEPDLDLDNDGAETYDLDLIEWDSDAATVSMGNAGGSSAVFDPEPSDLRETGDSTGIFQIVVEIPEAIPAGGDKLERGEEIILEYTDWGPSGADFVGDEDEDVNLTIFSSNFGATVELDQKVYSWTDKVYVTIVAPDHNFDSNLIDEIGESAEDPIKVATRGSDIDPYKLVETGTDTGIFTGEVILTGFTHDADGDPTTGDAAGNDVLSAPSVGVGPTDGFLAADDDDGITVSFEFSEDETVVGSALIRWNIGEVQWLEASYPATGTGVVRVVDPDLNLNPEAVDNFDVDVWSDSDAGGIDLTVTETNEATGIFEGTVFFTITDESSGHRLRVAEGDTITSEYEDNTLPDPYTTADELDITGTSIIGTIVPPLERAPASGLRVVDAFGNSLGEVSVDQQVQITSDLANGQDRDQAFAYLVQVQDGNGVTVSLAWITGSLTAGQSFSPALSWIPDASGTYTATAFVWESVDNPTALSPPVTTTVNVN